jgi:predicted metal-dependent phosphoesterase TrpH
LRGFSFGGKIELMKLDLHCHTRSSYDGLSSLRKIVKVAQKKGLDGIAITDHENTRAWREAEQVAKETGAVIILGEEIKTKQGDVLALFINKQIDGTGKELREVVKQIHDQGGLAIIPHPFHFYEGFKGKIEDYLDIIDGMEVFNARRPWGDFNEKALACAKKYNLAMTGGSDAHFAAGIGDGYTEIPDAKTIEDVKQGILNKQSMGFGHHSHFLYMAIPILAKILNTAREFNRTFIKPAAKAMGIKVKTKIKRVKQ